jgi:hypothetical protein
MSPYKRGLVLRSPAKRVIAESLSDKRQQITCTYSRLVGHYQPVSEVRDAGYTAAAEETDQSRSVSAKCCYRQPKIEEQVFGLLSFSHHHDGQHQTTARGATFTLLSAVLSASAIFSPAAIVCQADPAQITSNDLQRSQLLKSVYLGQDHPFSPPAFHVSLQTSTFHASYRSWSSHANQES